MKEKYVARFQNVFACSDVNRSFMYLCWLLQSAPTSNPHLFHVVEFPTPLLLKRAPAHLEPKSRKVSAN